MVHYILSLSLFFMLIITITICAAVSYILLYITRIKFDIDSFKENHEVGGFLFNALSLIYAVLMAFVVYATWTDYNTAKEICSKEANSIQNLFLNSEGLPEEVQPEIKQHITEYLNMIINEDWPLLADDEINPKSKQKLVDLWHFYDQKINLIDDKQKIYFTESLDILKDITEYRRERILCSQNHIPEVIWAVIVIGAITSFGFSLFFGTKNLKVQVAMTTLFATINAILIILILELDHPFAGEIKITPEPFEYVLNFIQNHL